MNRQLFIESNLEEVFLETVTLLKIVITTKLTGAHRQKGNAMTQERLNALAMLSMEKETD